MRDQGFGQETWSGVGCNMRHKGYIIDAIDI
jgi:hypothetical protein